MSNDRLYILLPGETFTLTEVIVNKVLKPALRFGAKTLEKYALDYAQRDEWKQVRFTLAGVVVIRGDKNHSRAVTRLGAHRSRNIRSYLELPKKYLRGENPMETSQLNTLLARVLVDVRQELGLPEDNPVDFSYELNDRVLASPMSEYCKQELEKFAVQGEKKILYPHELVKLELHLKSRCPGDAKEVLKTIKATKTREHLSSLSLSTVDPSGSDVFVSLANIHGDSLTLEGWKFCKLIEERVNPQLLGTIGQRRDYHDPVNPFSFNRNKSGEVLAKFIAETSTLHVFCKGEKDNQVLDKAVFIIDIDYALCVYITLKRLREDRERFNRLKEQADATVPCDLFDNLYTAS